MRLFYFELVFKSLKQQELRLSSQQVLHIPTRFRQERPQPHNPLTFKPVKTTGTAVAFSAGFTGSHPFRQERPQPHNPLTFKPVKTTGTAVDFSAGFMGSHPFRQERPRPHNPLTF